MATTINADTAVGGAIVTGDASGQLALQAAGVTKLTVSSSGVVLATPLDVASGGTGGSATPTAGGIVYGTGTVQAVTAAGTAGQYLQSNAGSAPTWATVSAGFTLGTPVATTSGTSIDFTGIPAGVKQIIISFAKVSTNGTDAKFVQIGDSGGIEITGYLSGGARFNGTTSDNTTSTDAFYINSVTTGDQLSGSLTLTLLDAATFTWVASGSWGEGITANSTFLTAGRKALSAELDRVRLTTLGGTNTFDLGSVNIAYI